MRQLAKNSTEGEKVRKGKVDAGGRSAFLIASMAACVLCLIMMSVSLAYMGAGRDEEFSEPPFDSMACAGTPNVGDDLGWSNVDAQAFRVSICGVFAPKEREVEVWLTNPSDNDVWLKVRVVDDSGSVMGETGLIRPGEYVRSVSLDRVPPQGQRVALKVMAYQPQTYYSEGSVSLETVVSEGV